MPFDLLGGAVGGLGAGLSGLLGGKKTAGRDVGNVFSTGMTDADIKNANMATQRLLNYQGSADALDPLQSSRTATKEVMGNPILSQLFGKGGAMERAGTEEQDLAKRGYSLKPEDYEAYGQASGNIARMFDKAEGGLAQSLANRGLSSSGVAGQAFMGSQGNKMEQLAQLQTDIAQKRMKMNLDRLAQTRNYLSGLGAQGAQAINQQYGRQLESEKTRFGQEQSKAEAGQNWLKNYAGQSNAQLGQRQATQETPGWASALQGGLGGILGGSGIFGSSRQQEPDFSGSVKINPRFS